MTEPPAVTLHVWRAAAQEVPRTVVGARRRARHLRTRGEATFTKVLGTASDAFVPTAATPARWALLTCWRGPADARFPVDGSLRERGSLSLRPLWARGTWDAQAPFGSGAAADARRWTGPVLVLTRATLRTRRALRFYRAVPGVAHDLRAARGCRVAFGIGESPLLRQGTVSVWESADAVRGFTSTSSAHRAAVAATPREAWYAEELFARFAVVDAEGSIDGIALS